MDGSLPAAGQKGSSSASSSSSCASSGSETLSEGSTQPLAAGSSDSEGQHTVRAEEQYGRLSATPGSSEEAAPLGQEELDEEDDLISNMIQFSDFAMVEDCFQTSLRKFTWITLEMAGCLQQLDKVEEALQNSALRFGRKN